MKVEGSGHGLPSLAPGGRALTTHCFGSVHNSIVERQCDTVLKRKMEGGERKWESASVDLDFLLHH